MRTCGTEVTATAAAALRRPSPEVTSTSAYSARPGHNPQSTERRIGTAREDPAHRTRYRIARSFRLLMRSLGVSNDPPLSLAGDGQLAGDGDAVRVHLESHVLRGTRAARRIGSFQLEVQVGQLRQTRGRRAACRWLSEILQVQGGLRHAGWTAPLVGP